MREPATDDEVSAIVQQAHDLLGSLAGRLPPTVPDEAAFGLAKAAGLLWAALNQLNRRTT